MSDSISVQLGVLGDLLTELRALGAELTDERQLTAASAWSLQRALAGPVGEQTRQAGEQWAALLSALEERTGAVAATLDAALVSYQAVDRELAAELAQRPGWRAGPQAVPR